jgi:hypothetical protein
MNKNRLGLAGFVTEKVGSGDSSGSIADFEGGASGCRLLRGL